MTSIIKTSIHEKKKIAWSWVNLNMMKFCESNEVFKKTRRKF